MQLVKTYLGRSAIEGVGVFAAEDIAQGTVIWRWVEGFDQAYDAATLLALPPQVRGYIERHTYTQRGRLWLCGDLEMFINHSDDANTHAPADDNIVVAIRPIRAGEEITNNYREFCEDTAHFQEFLGEGVALRGHR